MKRLLLIAPHLSTGGSPQYLVKKVELLRDEYDIFVVEYSDVTGGKLVVQRNRLISLLKNPLITLGEDKSELLNVIRRVNPDIVHMEEIPEMFCDNHIANQIYDLNRTYSIYETSHDSSFDIHYKRYIADKMILVSEYQRKLYEPLNIPIEVIDYPIEFSKDNRKEQYMRELGLDPTKKHVLNVGLFTPRKNQKEFFEYARRMPEYQFHSVGNMADNFRFYWEPLLNDVPPNLKIWDERSDVHKFFEAMDLFLFTSRGSNTDKETMPLVLKEAVASKIPICLYNLDVYEGFFDQFNNIHYMADVMGSNLSIIRNALNGLLNTPVPLLTVLIPTYNQKDYVKECVNSAISQKTTFNYNILISDDCSTDGAFDILEEYASVHSNVMLHRTEYNMGAENPNRILSLLKTIKTPYVAILDGDDHYVDDYLLQKHVDFLKNNDNYVISANRWIVTKDDMIVDGHYSDSDVIMHSLKTSVTIEDNINDGNFIGHGFVFKRHVLPNEFPNWMYDDDIFDSYWSLINLLLQFGDGYNHDFVGSRYRIHKSSAYSVKDIEYKIDKSDRQKNILNQALLGNYKKNINMNYNVSEYFDILYETDLNKITFNYKKDESNYFKVSIRDAESLAPIYWFDANFSNYVSYWCIPIPKTEFNFESEKSFSSILIEFYDELDTFKFNHSIYLKQSDGTRNVKLNLQHPYDCLFNNYNEMFVDNKYECYGLDNLDVVLDIGANSGLFSLMSLVKWGAKKVYAFEPNELSIKNLTSVVSEYPNIEIVKKAISDTDGYVQFYSSKFNTTISSTDKDRFVHEGILESDIVCDNVPSITLSTFIRDNNIQSISLLKIDIEGSEYDVIPSMNSEDFDKIENILIEFHNNIGNRVQLIIDILIKYGYDIIQIRDQSSKDNIDIKYSYQNSLVGTIFAKKKKYNKNFLVNSASINLNDMYNGHFNVKYKNVPYLKCPMDYVLYQMIINKLKPDLIIEIGTLYGGGALYYADLLDSIGLPGEVHSINIKNEVTDEQILNHNRIKLFTNGFENYDIEMNVKGFNTILVIDDASHTYDDVLRCLMKFSNIVSKNSYFIVEDGVVSFTGVEHQFSGGPRRAINEFLNINSDFVIDRSLCDFFGTNSTFNPDGYLKRIS